MSTTTPSESDAVRTLYDDAEFRVDISSMRPSTLCCSPARGEVRGVLVFVHGLAEHPARHLILARRLAAMGVRTMLPSLAGHAFNSIDDALLAGGVRAYAEHSVPAQTSRALESQAERNVRSVMRRLRGQLTTLHGRMLVEQIREARAVAFQEGPAGVPQLLGGMSLGGLVALATAQQQVATRDPPLAGLLLINPALAPCGPPTSALQRMIVQLVWRLRVAGIPLGALLRAATRLMPAVDVRWVSAYVSDVPDEQRLQAADPYVHRELPARFLAAIQDLMLSIRRRTPATGTPCLFCLSARDVIVDPRGARGLIDRQSQCESQCIDPVVFAEQSSHELLRSSDAPSAMARIERWISQRIAAGV